MKLLFKKNEDSQITVYQKLEDSYQEFSYVEMIKTLIETRKLEDPDFEGDFSESEKNSIKSMVTFINDEIAMTDEVTVESSL